MKVTLAQVNTTVGDFEGNTARALGAVRAAAAQGADLVVLPEQTITGYPAKDLLLQKGFVARNVDALHRFAAQTTGLPAVLIGFAEPHEGLGAGLYNSAALCRGGRVEAVYRKALLPTYDVFDEDRYFDEGTGLLLFDCAGRRVGVTICEDLWNDALYWSHRRYARDPVAETVAAGAEVVVNLSASPFTLGKPAVRRAMIASAARRHGVPVLQCNLVGANDDVVFDGASLAFGAGGECLGAAEAFAEDARTLDPWATPSEATAPPEDLEQLRRALVLGIQDYTRKCGFRKVLLGLSGGIDSALVAALAAEALGAENVLGVAMPSRYSSDHSVTDAELLARNLGIRSARIPVEPLFAAALTELSPHLEGGNVRIATENMQARLRGVTLMSLSNAHNALVLTTGNKSELSVGYCTLYGDMCGGLAVIGDVPKMQVYALSHWLNQRAGRALIPEGTLTKPPSAELAPNQKDTDSLPPYEVLDEILRCLVENLEDPADVVARGFEEATVRRVARLVQINEYKRRQAAPTLKVTSRAFGIGWRMPIARSLNL